MCREPDSMTCASDVRVGSICGVETSTSDSRERGRSSRQDAQRKTRAEVQVLRSRSNARSRSAEAWSIFAGTSFEFDGNMPSVVQGPIESFMTEDHVELDRTLGATERAGGVIDDEAYTRFRGGLLRHIAMEEKVLLPFARAKRGESLAMATELRADHSEIAKLLVRSPSASIIASLREILGKHNRIEEGPGGLYAICDALAGEEAVQIVVRLRAQPEVPLAKYYDGPLHRHRRVS